MTANIDPTPTPVGDVDPDEPAPVAPAWIEWVARAIAVLVVVPLRVLWEFLGVVVRALYRYLLTPLGRLVRAVWDGLGWLTVHLLVIPIGWLGRNLIVAPIRWLWGRRRLAGRCLTRYLLRPLGWLIVNLVARPAYWLLTYLIVIPVRWLAQTLRPVGRLFGAWVASAGRGLIWLLSIIGRLIGFIAHLLYRYLLRPFGLGVAWLARHGAHLVARGFVLVGLVLVAVFRGLGWLGQRLLVRPGYWLLIHLVVLPVRWLAVTLRPVGRMLLDAVRFGWHAGGWLLLATSRLLYRYLLRPFGRAIAWAWRHSAVLLWRGVVAVWRTVVAPTARAVGRTAGSTRRYVRDRVWRPMANTSRALLASLGLRR